MFFIGDVHGGIPVQRSLRGIRCLKKPQYRKAAERAATEKQTSIFWRNTCQPQQAPSARTRRTCIWQCLSASSHTILLLSACTDYAWSNRPHPPGHFSSTAIIPSGYSQNVAQVNSRAFNTTAISPSGHSFARIMR